VAGCAPPTDHGTGLRPSIADRLHALLVDADEDDDRDDLPEHVLTEVPGNAAKQVVAMALQKAGDLVVDPKTVLAWLLASVGAPSAAAAMLVPVRESGSMLPQTALVPWVRSLPVRKWVWVVGAAGQAVAVLAMATLAATTTGAVAGWGIVGALAVFALARSLSSIASKDVMGRTIPRGQRGQVNGLATVASGLVAVTIGLALRLFGGDEGGAGTFAALLGVAALAWVAAGAVYASLREASGEHDEVVDRRASARALALLRDDAPFRRFVVARTLLLVSALTPPFVVALATEVGGAGLAGLGPFVIGSGVAALVGGRGWGRFADRSSRLVMVWAAASAAAVVLVLLLLLQVEGLREVELLYPATYLLLALAHTGSRIGRKTYVIDLADGNRRTDYVAVSNAAMGVLLLVTGAVSAAIASFGPEAALLFLAALGIAAVPVGLSLPETVETTSGRDTETGHDSAAGPSS
jgi:hypothetical protein